MQQFIRLIGQMKLQGTTGNQKRSIWKKEQQSNTEMLNNEYLIYQPGNLDNKWGQGSLGAQ